MYGIVRPLVPSLGATDAVVGEFVARGSREVVLVKRTGLELYRLVGKEDETRLRLISEIQLYGVVQSCAVLRMPGCRAESLLLGFDGLRCATMSWDCGVNGWNTDTIFSLQELMRAENVDDDDVAISTLGAAPGLVRGRVAMEDEAQVRADPTGRCFVALARAASKLFVVPVAVTRKAKITSDSAVNQNDVFWIDLEEYGIQHVKEVVFLLSTFEPTVLILYEPSRSWAGRVAVQSNSVSVVAFALDVIGHSHRQLWKITDLPYDAFTALAVPDTAGGGALVVAGSSVIHLRYGSVISGLSFNSFGDAMIAKNPALKPVVVQSPAIASLDIARCCFLDPAEPSAPQNTAIFALKGGELYFLTLPAVGSRDVMRVTRAGSSVVASQIVPLSAGYFLLASRTADSILVQYDRRIEKTAAAAAETKTTADATASEKDVGNEKDGRRAAGDDSVDQEMRDTFMDENDEMNVPWNETWSLKVRDTIQSIGPGADAAIGKNERGEEEKFEEEEDIHERGEEYEPGEDEVELVVGGGHGRHGGITVLERSIRPMYNTKFPLEGCNGAWTLRDPAVTASRIKARERYNTALTARNAKTAERNMEILNAKERWIAEQKVEQERLIRDRVAEKKTREEEENNGYGNEETEGRRMEDPADEIIDEEETLEQTFRDIERAAENQFIMEEETPLEETPEDEEDLHAYLLLSSKDSTIVLETGAEIAPLQDVDFREDSPTLAAGNVLSNRVIVQVHNEGARFLRGRRMFLDYSLPHDAAIVAAQVMDPYVLLRLSNGIVVVLYVENEDDEGANAAAAARTSTVGIGESLMDEYGGGMDELDDLNDDATMTGTTVKQVFETDFRRHGFLTAAALYKGPMARSRYQSDAIPETESLVSDGVQAMVGDEEYMLYGEEDIDDVPEVRKEPDNSQEGWLLLVVNQEGVLEMFDMDIFVAVFRSGHFYLGPMNLEDDGAVPTQLSSENEESQVDVVSRIVAVGMTAIPGTYPDTTKVPILTGILPHGGFIIYSAFLTPEDRSEGGWPLRSRIRFRKVVVNDIYTQGENPPSIHSFENLTKRAGMFLTGRRPFFIFAERGFPRVHPLRTKRGVDLLYFTELHNVNCPHGFVMLDRDGIVSIGALPPAGVVSYENPWPMRRIQLRCSVHHLAYHAETSSYGILTSTLVPRSREEVRKSIKAYSSQVQVEKEKSEAQGNPGVNPPEDEGVEASALAAENPTKFPERLPTLMDEKHEIHLYRPDTWELVKKHPLKEFEVGLSIKSMSVDVYKMAKTGAPAGGPQQQKGDPTPSLFAATVKLRPKNMLVVGTGYLRGEDASARGRLLMFEVSKQERFLNDGKISTFQMQLIAEKELKGQVSAVETLQGYVVVGVGPKVEVYKLVEDEIVCCSFFFAQLFCTSISSLKQFILIGDMFKSVSLIYWRDRNKSLNFLGKDYEPLETYATEFLLLDDELSLLCSDSKGNIQLFNYENASVAESRGGTRLLANGGLHLGSRVNCFVRVRSEPRKRGEKVDNGAGQQLAMFATLDCGLGAVVPVHEATFKRLLALQNKLSLCADLPFYAGLTPRGFRAFRAQTKSHFLLNKRLLDGQLLMEYHRLDAVRKKEIARQIGLSVGEIMETLESLDKALIRF